MRPLYDDGASSATAATRDYVIRLREEEGAAAVDVFGGKITTYRRLAEAVMAKLGGGLPGDGRGLDGAGGAAGRGFSGGRGGGAGGGADGGRFRSSTRAGRGGWCGATAPRRRLMLDGARAAEDLGERFGWDLTEREVRWLMEREWARTAEDVLWRRTKLGLRLTPAEAARLAAWMAAEAQGRTAHIAVKEA